MLIAAVGSLGAQGSETVTIAASDGQSLWGEYSDLGSNQWVFMLHANGGDHRNWASLIPQLSGQGYNTLAVDQRGHGETGGTTDWAAAAEDVGSWMDWIEAYEAGSEAQVAMIGSSVGANLALSTCAEYSSCRTVIALSPGWDFFGVMPVSAFEGELSQRPIYLVASRGDSYSAESILSLAAAGSGDVALRSYSGSEHGTAIFDHTLNGPSLETGILGWLEEQMPIDLSANDKGSAQPVTATPGPDQ
jgi:pimeloyl-ACP methyl ester carboxylesterase